MHPLKDKACIVGVGQTPYTRGTNRSALEPDSACDRGGRGGRRPVGAMTLTVSLRRCRCPRSRSRATWELRIYAIAARAISAAPLAGRGSSDRRDGGGVGCRASRTDPDRMERLLRGGRRGAGRGGPVGLPPSFGLTMSEY